MTINWTVVSTLTEMVGALVVVVSLWYVGVQIRQNTRAALATSRQGLLAADLGLITDYITHGIDPHLIGDDVQLSPLDERRFTWIVIKAIRIREFAWHQLQCGSLDEASWESYMAPIPGIFSTQRAKAILDFYTGNPEFMKILRTRAMLAPPSPPPAGGVA
ncbi:hypothetical protein J2X02_002636 [Pseudoxanthomonas japonensis]|uniref:hypothetical protein n=1 Tax=Pseudoxanthomonas japonensis TaxID=69284 RepID=UPI002859FC17|nr:hypothetical protein [Pseudoxanthomonas japonensis]MDR7069785.1 hypothetical protein [Pseudoxanthomonas japonensis]